MSVEKPLWRRTSEIVASGLLLGIGFGVAIFLIAIGIDYVDNGKVDMFGSNKNMSEFIEIVNDRNLSTSDSLIVVGTIKNTYQKPMYAIRIEVEFFDDGIFVDECRDSVQDVVNSNELENFKVQCKNVKHKDIKHDSHKVKIIMARESI